MHSQEAHATVPYASQLFMGVTVVDKHTYDASDIELPPVTFANAKVIVLYDDAMPPLWWRHPIKRLRFNRTSRIFAWWRMED